MTGELLPPPIYLFPQAVRPGSPQALRLGSPQAVRPGSPQALRPGLPEAAPQPLPLRVGFDIHIEFTSPTTTLLMLYIHPDVAAQLHGGAEHFHVQPSIPIETFLDGFGNRVGRLIVPEPGLVRLSHEAVFQTVHTPEPQPTLETIQNDVATLPTDALPYLLGSRYCEVDRLSAIAWDMFGKLPPGGARVLAINQWVFKNIHFGYRFTRPNKTALDTCVERTGVCRDMMHLAIAFCRAMNIPARYAGGYLGDIDADPDPTPMDFSAFYEVYLAGKWWAMDARNGRARVGRALMARGRDAADTALITSFGPHKLKKFEVITEPVGLPVTAPLVAPTSLAMSA